MVIIGYIEKMNLELIKIINTYFNTNKCLKDGLSYIKFDVKVSYDGVDEFGPNLTCMI